MRRADTPHTENAFVFAGVSLAALGSLLGAALAVAACGSPAPAADAGSDAASQSDSGPPDASPRSGCVRDRDCDDGVYCNGEERCDPSHGSANRFGCVSGTPACESPHMCVEAEERCMTRCEWMPDADGDGADHPDCGGTDCDDSDGNRFPGNLELCDAAGHDEDCDPTTLGHDHDGDGFVSAACCNVQLDGSLLCGTDCDDTLSGVNPGAPESCNSVDDDCNAMIDDGVLVTFYRDEDGDMFGVDTDTTAGCSAPPGYALVPGDCDDAVGGVNPGVPESCDSLDNDCDTRIDEGAIAVTCYRDIDGDSFGDPAVTMTACFCAAGWVEATLPDCQDDDASVYPTQAMWFGTSYVDPSGAASFDYDCDGEEEQRWTVAKGGPCSALASSGSRCNGQGWASSTPPACGVEGDWIDCIFIELQPFEANRCVRASSDIRRRQQCR